MARDSIKELQKGNFDPTHINAIFEEVRRRYQLPFTIKTGGLKEDALRRQWAVSLNSKN